LIVLSADLHYLLREGDANDSVFIENYYFLNWVRYHALNKHHWLIFEWCKCLTIELI
jgi:hypothetical protein